MVVVLSGERLESTSKQPDTKSLAFLLEHLDQVWPKQLDGILGRHPQHGQEQPVDDDDALGAQVRQQVMARFDDVLAVPGQKYVRTEEDVGLRDCQARAQVVGGLL